MIDEAHSIDQVIDGTAPVTDVPTSDANDEQIPSSENTDASESTTAPENVAPENTTTPESVAPESAPQSDSSGSSGESGSSNGGGESSGSSSGDVSAFRSYFPIAHAQEVPAPQDISVESGNPSNDDVTAIDITPSQNLDEVRADDFLEVLYTFDGSNWKHLGYVSAQNWRTASFTLSEGVRGELWKLEQRTKAPD